MKNDSSVAELEALLRTGRRRSLPKGQVLGNIWESVGLAYVESGYIKRYLITKEGNQSILVIYGPGYFFPFTPVYRSLFGLELYDGDEFFYYEAISDATISTIPMATLEEECAKNPKLYREMLFVAGTRLKMVIAQTEGQSLGNSYRNLVQQLAYFADTFGEKTAEGTKILLPLTNSDLAGVLNVARETVSRSLSRMKQKGLIKPGYNIIIPDLEKLRQEVK